MSERNLWFFDCRAEAMLFAKQNNGRFLHGYDPQVCVWIPISKEERNRRSRERCSARFFYRRILAINQRRKRLGKKIQITDLKKATAELAWVWIKQRGKCYFTGERLTRDNAQLDHIKPVAKGGSDKTSNLCFVIKQVNQAKGGMNEKEFITMCANVFKYRHGEA